MELAITDDGESTGPLVFRKYNQLKLSIKYSCVAEAVGPYALEVSAGKLFEFK